MSGSGTVARVTERSPKESSTTVLEVKEPRKRVGLDREVRSEGSETAKVGTDVQEPDRETRWVGLGGTSHQCPKVFRTYLVDPAVIDRRKMHLPGYGNRHEGGMNHSQALPWNAGNLSKVLKGKLKHDIHVRQLPRLAEVTDEIVVVMKPL